MTKIKISLNGMNNNGDKGKISELKDGRAIEIIQSVQYREKILKDW